MNDLLTKIQDKLDLMPRRQRTLCEYICKNLFECSALTIVEMAEKARVGTTTVIRTIQALGYESYVQFKNDLHEVAVEQAKTSYAGYWDLTRRQLEQGRDGEGVSTLLTECEIVSKRLNQREFIGKIEEGAGMILRARRIFIIGLRSSYPLGLYLGSLLTRHGLSVCQLSDSADYMYDVLAGMTGEDVLIAVASAHLIVKRTVEVVRICHDRNIPTIILTDSSDTILYKEATLAINTECTDWNMTMTAVSIFIAIELLCQEVGARTVSITQGRLKQIEDFLRTYQLEIWDSGSIGTGGDQ
ncbi:MurR/RpiR family transcriptional regulator [Oscillibacter sp. MSJ-2]|uniref:MurR/RpiR family transcriptional regulator n=1 Tax=Dysosmobacter acutus TaxID=2841504 RepID=A0ABS6FF29_9FIRM|nr:MurR/RpiR family transcriptional regulator [Dysosmobacter acutus]MBU5627970.1 MurR/RpiR family transcriptional regulator [Dysosmobacter acutus]